MAQKEPFFTAPNLVTLSRLPLAALVWLRPSDPLYLFSLMVIAGITDMLDGWLERRQFRREGRSDCPQTIGAWLDPLCDKFFALSVIAAVLFTRRPPGYIILLLTAREIIQTAVTLAWKLVPAVRSRLNFDFRATVVGKAATVAQFLSVAAILTRHAWQLPLALATGALGITAGTSYVLRAWNGRGNGR